MDTNPDNQNKRTNDPYQPQGIFSTPELTIDTDKITPDAKQNTESKRAKIASIFANTETGKQAQRLNEAMIANTQPVTEDIIIDNEPKRKRKMWPIILAVAAVAVVGAAIVAIMSNGNSNIKNIREAFDVYMDALNSGLADSSCEPPEGVPMVEYLGEFSCSVEQSSEIVSEILAKYISFKDAFNESSLSSNESLSVLIEHQDVYLSVLSRYLDQRSMLTELFSLYRIGEPSITVDKLYDVKDTDAKFNATLSQFSEDFSLGINNVIKEYNIYYSASCLLYDGIDYSCIELLDNTAELNRIDQQQTELIGKLEDLFPRVVYQMFGECDEIRKGLYE